MRISKDLATKIATAALAFRNEEIEKAEKEFQELLDRVADESTPQEVKDLAKNHRSYLDFSDTAFMVVEGQKLNRRKQLTKAVPCVHQNYSSYIIYISQQADAAIGKKELRVQTLNSKLYEDIEALETAIYQLRTKANVLRELPELEKYFPSEMTTALVPNFQSLRNLLKP